MAKTNEGRAVSMQTETAQYEKYKQYYPDKWAAISALRMETGLCFEAANRIINSLFGVTDDDERRKADAEHEQWYQQQQAEETLRKAAAKKRKKRAGLIAGIGLIATMKAIFGLAKKYE